MAKNELRKGILLSIMFGSVLPAQDVKELVADGIAKAERNEFRAALTPLTSALAKDPKHFGALRWRGHCRNALGMHAAALTDYGNAIEVDPQNAWVWYARGMAKHHLERSDEAIVDYSEAIRLDPTNFKAIEWRGFNKSKVGDHLGAYLDFTAAARVDSQNPWVFAARGRAAAVLGAYPQAQKDFEAALLLEPKDPDTLAQLGYVHVATGDRKAAFESFEKAFALDPKRNDYARLFRYWLKRGVSRTAGDPRDELPSTGWTGELAKTLLGDRTKARLLLRLSSYSVEPDEIAARKCEAAFYLGLRAQIEGRPNRAREHFRDALVIGDASMPEWRAARKLARR